MSSDMFLSDVYTELDIYLIVQILFKQRTMQITLPG